MKRIIIADDDPGIQEVMKLILTRFGFLPEIHRDATRLYANDFDEPDLFIIDKQLQNSDGLEVCRFLKNRGKFNTPVIIFSASRRLDEQALAAGADGFLEKPFGVDALLRMIKNVCP